MSTQYAMLGLIAKEASYGYSLKQMYDDLFGSEKPILAGQIYSTLSRLKKNQQIIEIANSDASGGPARTCYETTEIGTDALLTWLNTPEAPSPNLHSTIYIKTVLALLLDGDAAAYLQNQRHAHIQRMRELVEKRRNSSLAEHLQIDHAIFHIEADLRWIDLTSSHLTALKEELHD